VPLGDPDGLDLEKVAALAPDLILATNYYGLPNVYEGLSAIAPTVGYRTGWGEATWQDTARVIGRAVGNNPTLLNVPWQLEQQRAVLERVAAP
jgi:iron-siderophore transport system substrate-binding protein